MLSLSAFTPSSAISFAGKMMFQARRTASVLSHGYCNARSVPHRTSSVQSLVINARPYEIIGVLPASFTLLDTDPQVILATGAFNRANALTGRFRTPRRGPPQTGVTLSQGQR